jgi:hypothetical protein
MSDYENQDPNREADYIRNDASFWYDRDGWLHRDNDLPAFTRSYGYEEYYTHGLFHRDGGKPAIIHQDGCVEFWLHGVRVQPTSPEMEESTERQLIEDLKASHDAVVAADAAFKAADVALRNYRQKRWSDLTENRSHENL